MQRSPGFAVVALFVSALSLTAAEKTDPLYPLKVGNTWTYRESGSSITVKVEKQEKFADKDCYKLETSANGVVGVTEHVFVEVDGVYRASVNDLKPDTPIKFLALSAEKGKKWTVNTKIGEQEVSGEFKIDEQDVTVPLGTYKGATVVESSNCKIGSTNTSLKMWFVKD